MFEGGVGIAVGDVARKVEDDIHLPGPFLADQDCVRLFDAREDDFELFDLFVAVDKTEIRSAGNRLAREVSPVAAEDVGAAVRELRPERLGLPEGHLSPKTLFLTLLLDGSLDPLRGAGKLASTHPELKEKLIEIRVVFGECMREVKERKDLMQLPFEFIPVHDLGSSGEIVVDCLIRHTGATKDLASVRRMTKTLEQISVRYIVVDITDLIAGSRVRSLRAGGPTLQEPVNIIVVGAAIVREHLHGQPHRERTEEDGVAFRTLRVERERRPSDKRHEAREVGCTRNGHHLHFRYDDRLHQDILMSHARHFDSGREFLLDNRRQKDPDIDEDNGAGDDRDPIPNTKREDPLQDERTRKAVRRVSPKCGIKSKHIRRGEK